MATLFDDWVAQLMEKAADVPLREALSKGMLVLCPVCKIAHPGVRFLHPDHRQYCSTNCFRERAKGERGG